MAKRTLGIAIGALVMASAAAIPAPASATGRCDASSLESTCDVLERCYADGAIDTALPPADAVAYFRTCLFTDHSYDLVLTGTGVIAQKRPGPLLHIYESTFWPLYCQALERAGRSDRSICERGSARASSGNVKSKSKSKRRHHRRRSSPRFTG